MNYNYGYDASGRITSVNGTAYTYDEAGQLKTVTYPGGSESYAYDSNGNITAKTVTSSGQALGDVTETHTFVYDGNLWEDRLVSFDGQQISYDAIGNPVTYLGAALTWRGRELTSYTKGGKSIEYTYDVDGMRYNKTVKTNGVVTAEYDYVYSDGKLIAVTCTQNNHSDTARFIYDECGEVRGFIYNGATAYLYLKNLQGDVTALVSDSGEIVMTYTYDAWGAVSYSVSTMQNMQLAVSFYKYGKCKPR